MGIRECGDMGVLWIGDIGNMVWKETCRTEKQYDMRDSTLLLQFTRFMQANE